MTVMRQLWCGLLLIVLTTAHGLADVAGSVNAVAGNLVASRGALGWNGRWGAGYNGNIVGGLANSYLLTGVQADKDAALAGASTIVNTVTVRYGGRYNFNEAFGVAEAGTIAGAGNAYTTALHGYFDNISVPTMVAALDAGYGGQDKSFLTINLAYYTVAAYRVDAGNKTELRSALVTALGQVADTSKNGSYQWYPTEALGAALWALASTGALDNTPITGPSAGVNVFGGKTLSQLPGMLAARVDPATGTFFYLLTDDSDAGYTDDTALGLMGLKAVALAGDHRFDGSIFKVQNALLGAADSAGVVHDSITSPTDYGQEYAGNFLQALAMPTPQVGVVQLAQLPPAGVPEPATLAVVGAGVALLLTRRRM